MRRMIWEMPPSVLAVSPVGDGREARRRRRGPQMFHKYAAMTMEERDTIAVEWQKTLRLGDVPAVSKSNL